MTKRDKLKVIDAAIFRIENKVEHFICRALMRIEFYDFGISSESMLHNKFVELFMPDDFRRFNFDYEHGIANFYLSYADSEEALGRRLTALGLFRAMVETGDV